MKILINDGLSLNGQKLLCDSGIEFDNVHYDEKDLLDRISEYDAILVRSATTVTKEVIDAGVKLKVIARSGTGIDNIEHEYARSKGISILNTPGANSASVAELVLAHIFALARFIPDSKVSLQEGKWNKKSYKGFEVAGKTLGIIGFGRIGQILAEKARCLGMKVAAYDLMDVKSALKVEMLDFDSLLASSDIVSMHVPKMDKALISKAEIAKMKNGACLINCARGGVVDESAVLSALQSGKLLAYGTDVFESEPDANPKLVHHARVSVTPHIGASTIEAQDRVGIQIAEKLINSLKK